LHILNKSFIGLDAGLLRRHITRYARSGSSQ